MNIIVGLTRISIEPKSRLYLEIDSSKLACIEGFLNGWYKGQNKGDIEVSFVKGGNANHNLTFAKEIFGVWSDGFCILEEPLPHSVDWSEAYTMMLESYSNKFNTCKRVWSMDNELTHHHCYYQPSEHSFRWTSSQGGLPMNSAISQEKAIADLMDFK